MMNNLFTLWTPDPAGVILGTGYFRFETPFGVQGLARFACDDNELDILAVVSEQQGKGQFRNFLNHSKECFESISVWEVWNLIHYGFEPATRIEKGETLNGWRWSRM
jgi:hypothetical protein